MHSTVLRLRKNPFQKNKTAKAALAAMGCLIFAGSLAPGCGVYLPNRLLDSGGYAIFDTPEFYFELEMRQLAKDYPTEFKAIPPKDGDYSLQTVAADEADFADAIKNGEIAPKDAEEAERNHKAVRALLTNVFDEDGVRVKMKMKAGDVPAEFPGEFADYDRGAVFYINGQTDEARKVWEALLTLPKEQRHYRSTWAAYMLGKMDVLAEKPEAGKWFQMVRQLAKEGFADTPGLASSSLGWEARYVDDLEKPDIDALEAAAKLYLQQFAGGDPTTIESLKGVAGMAQAEGYIHLSAERPLLRKIVTSSILASLSPASYDNYAFDDGQGLRNAQRDWLAAVEKANLANVEDADRLGWIAYSMGKYEDAARWLKRADPNSALSLWLSAKLDFRAGKTAEATGAMAKAVAKIPPNEEMQFRKYDWDTHEIPPSGEAQGDLGMLQLARGEFTGAFKAFFAGGHWLDAAYVAERVMTVKELIAVVDRDFPPNAATEKQEARAEDWDFVRGYSDTPEDRVMCARYLLGRRLVRLGRCEEARPYFPKWMRATLDEYAAALKRADDPKAARRERAAGLWKAAQLARKNGMELMGAEVEPDASLWDGQYEISDVAADRIHGKYKKGEPNYPSPISYPAKEADTPLVIPSTEAERKRIAQQPMRPDLRFHYRFVAANLGWEAAKLMPDNDEQTALVLNTAGSWIKDRDDKAADRFYQAIEKRCPNTVIGSKAVKQRWFVSEDDTAVPQQQ